MLRTKLAKKVLTKKEQKHLTESGIHNLKHMENQIVHMYNLAALDNKPVITICPDCFRIAKKLGMIT